MKDDVPVVELRHAPDGGPHKSTYGGWKAVYVAVLADGTEEQTSNGYRLKRDATAFLSSLPCKPRNPMAAFFDDEGKCIGFSERISLS